MSDITLSAVVAARAAAQPDAPAFVTVTQRVTWREYDDGATRVAGALVTAGIAPGSRVGVLCADGLGPHVAFLACERAGAVVVGIGARAGEREVAHLLEATDAVAVIVDPAHAELAARAGARRILVFGTDTLTEGGAAIVPSQASALAGRAVGSTDLFLCNSTSGTTGLPKIVMHTQARWFAFHRFAVAAGDLTEHDVWCSALPAPFGFGLWTAHFTPTILGCPTVLLDRFDAEGCLALLERERVTVLACVSTQLVMLTNAPSFGARDLALRVVFTGGEMVPYERAARFEDQTGCAVLQFYGSNETGALSGTTLRDSRERRLRTAGRVIADMQVRLYSEDGADVTATGGPGIAACHGPATSSGYLGDDDVNRQLFTPDGWMLTGDLATIDADGYLTVVGRASDIVIRGGKNISAALVEDEVATHPAVALAAVVAMPDAVFGERVCVYVEVRPGHPAPGLDDLRAHLAARGTGKELWPEVLVALDALPRSSGGKVAKGALRADARVRASGARGS